MNLVRIPTEELEKVWSLVEKDIRQALAYSSQLTDSNFVFEIAKQNKFVSYTSTHMCDVIELFALCDK